MAVSEKKSIIIIGGGIIGSSIAYYLTRHPKYNADLHSIHIIEGTKIAAGASGRAGGLLALWAYPSCLVPLSFKLHADLAKEHDGAARWGYRRLSCGELTARGRVIKAKPSVSGEMNGTTEETTGLHNTGGRIEGNVIVQRRTPASSKNPRKASLPEDLDWFADECVQEYDMMGTPENTAQVHPFQFTTSMVNLAEEKGAKIIFGTVTEIKSSSSGHSVCYTDRESKTLLTITASDVVLAAGPWTKRLLDDAPIGSLRAHSVTIRPSRPTSAYAIFTSIHLPKDFREDVKSRALHVTPEIYARPNNELYVCGEGDHTAPLPKTAADVQVDEKRCQDIIDYVSSVSDELRDGKVLTRQACYLPQVECGGGPFLGPTHERGLWLAAGHTCWGIQNGPGTGKLMSEFVMDGEASSANVGSLDPRQVL